MGNDNFVQLIDHIYIYQELSYSISTISIMTDSTVNAIEGMHHWKFTDKDEMKHLGGTIIKMEHKFIELSILNLSKIIEDFFNNLERYAEIKLNIWHSSCDEIIFSKEMRMIRHLGNVIKHDNSIIDSSSGARSVNALIDDYGFKDETPISYLDIFKPSIKKWILLYTYMSNEFCYEILKSNGFLSKDRKILSEEEIIKYMYENFIYSIPGHPKKEG